MGNLNKNCRVPFWKLKEVHREAIEVQNFWHDQNNWSHTDICQTYEM